MGTEAQTEQQNQEQPAKETPKPAVQTQQEQPPKQQAKSEQPAPKAEPSKNERTRHALKEDEDPPEEVDLLELTPRALKSRLTRFSKQQLRDQFGTDDVDQIKKDLADLKSLREEKEETRRKSLDEKSRLEEDLKKERTLRTAAESRAKEVANERVVEREDGRLKEMAGEFVKPKFWKHVARDMAEWLNSEFKTDAEFSKVKDKDIKKWLKAYVEENPEYAKASEGGGDGAAKKPLNNGVNDKERPNASPPEKPNFSPKSNNALSPAQAKAEAKKMGFSWT